MPLSDGRAVCLYNDPQKTAANFAHFSDGRRARRTSR